THPRILLTAALAYYRAEQYEEAIELAGRVQAVPEGRIYRPLVLLIQALAGRRLGWDREARACLQEAEAWFELQYLGPTRSIGSLSWAQMALFQVLRQEALAATAVR